ncbi:MAG: hypothetical protein QJR11_01255 [Fulvimonas sp.]|nr:hypothetical protein [Fulvimonas sp.]
MAAEDVTARFAGSVAEPGAGTGPAEGRGLAGVLPVAALATGAAGGACRPGADAGLLRVGADCLVTGLAGLATLAVTLALSATGDDRLVTDFAAGLTALRPAGRWAVLAASFLAAGLRAGVAAARRAPAGAALARPAVVFVTLEAVVLALRVLLAAELGVDFAISLTIYVGRGGRLL